MRCSAVKQLFLFQKAFSMKKNFKAFLNPLLFTIDVSKRSLVDEMASKGGGGSSLNNFSGKFRIFESQIMRMAKNLVFWWWWEGWGRVEVEKKYFFLQKSLLLVGTLNIP